jgi:hypothetical protein
LAGAKRKLATLAIERMGGEKLVKRDFTTL